MFVAGAAKPANEVSTDSAAPGTGAGGTVAEFSMSSKPANEVSTDSGRSMRSHCEPHRPLIELAVSMGRNAMSIWQELVDEHEFGGRYSSVKRFVRRLLGTGPWPGPLL